MFYISRLSSIAMQSFVSITFKSQHYIKNNTWNLFFTLQHKCMINKLPQTHAVNSMSFNVSKNNAGVCM